MGCPSCLRLGRQDHRLHHPSRGRLQRIGVDMTKEALKLALEALEADPAEMVEDENGHMVFRRIQAIITLREALANEALEKMAENARELGLDYEPEQEPVAWAKFSAKGNIIDLLSEPDDDYTPLYTTPPQRTWVGLTYEEQRELYKKHEMDGWGHFYNAIEAKLKEKNT